MGLAFGGTFILFCSLIFNILIPAHTIDGFLVHTNMRLTAIALLLAALAFGDKEG